MRARFARPQLPQSPHLSHIGRSLALGNTALMEQLGVDVSSLSAQAEELRSQGESVMHLAVDGQLAGLLAVSAPINPVAWRRVAVEIQHVRSGVAPIRLFWRNACPQRLH
jgi:hypothetical protein